ECVARAVLFSCFHASKTGLQKQENFLDKIAVESVLGKLVLIEQEVRTCPENQSGVEDALGAQSCLCFATDVLMIVRGVRRAAGRMRVERRPGGEPAELYRDVADIPLRRFERKRISQTGGRFGCMG